MVFIAKKIALASIVFVFFSVYGCSRCDKASPQKKVSTAENETLRGDRWTTIMANYKKIDVGMTKQEVKQLLGIPDRESALFEPQKYRPRKIGFTCFYMKSAESGYLSRGIAVRFGLDKKVMSVDEVELRNP